MATVAVDVMGGDFAPAEIVNGCVQAHREDGREVILVGPEAYVLEAMQTCDAKPGEGLEVVDAGGIIAMDDADPARAVRTRRDASVCVASRLVRMGRADAIFSAGSTGATLAAGVLEIGRVRGVARPGLSIVLPFPGAPTVLIDCGANADVRPEHLVTFGVLGSLFAELILGIASPRVGLLSIGEEPGKGNELVHDAYPLLESSGVRFIGNVEGRDVPTDTVDVVVTDGFTGNVVLKLLEGFAKFLMNELLAIFAASDEAKRAAAVVMPGLLELRSTLSPDTYGGAQLLGVKGVAIIGHGSSNAAAVRAAIDGAARTAESGFVGRVVDHFGSMKTAGGPGGRSERSERAPRSGGTP